MTVDKIWEKDGYVMRSAQPADVEVLRDAVRDGEQYADDILMAILEDEWRRIKGL